MASKSSAKTPPRIETLCCLLNEATSQWQSVCLDGGRPTSQPRETFSQSAHLLSVTEVNSQIGGEISLICDSKAKAVTGLSLFHVQPHHVAATMGIMVRGGLAGCSADVMRRSDPPELVSTGDGTLRPRFGSPVSIKEIS